MQLHSRTDSAAPPSSNVREGTLRQSRLTGNASASNAYDVADLLCRAPCAAGGGGAGVAPDDPDADTACHNRTGPSRARRMRWREGLRAGGDHGMARRAAPRSGHPGRGRDVVPAAPPARRPRGVPSGPRARRRLLRHRRRRRPGAGTAPHAAGCGDLRRGGRRPRHRGRRPRGGLRREAPVASARVWWTFRAFGHDRVAILDGGFPRWRDEGRPVEAGEPSPGRRRFTARFRPELVTALDDVRRNLETHRAQVVDARSAGRFAGTEPEPPPGLRGGHIPGQPQPAVRPALRPDGRCSPRATSGGSSRRRASTSTGRS